MLKSFTENVRSYFYNSAQGQSQRRPGVNRKRQRDEFEDDPDIQITEAVVGKKQRIEPSHSVINYLKGSINKMTSWMNPPSTKGPNATQNNWVTVSTHRNGNHSKPPSLNGKDILRQNTTMNSRKFSTDFVHPTSNITDSSRLKTYNDRHRHSSVSSQSSNGSFFNRKRQSTASATMVPVIVEMVKNPPTKKNSPYFCIRLKEKEEYHRLLQQHTNQSWGRTPMQTKVHDYTAGRSLKTSNSQGHTSVLGSSLFNPSSDTDSKTVPKFRPQVSRHATPVFTSAPSHKRERQNQISDINSGAPITNLLQSQRYMHSVNQRSSLNSTMHGSRDLPLSVEDDSSDPRQTSAFPSSRVSSGVNGRGDTSRRTSPASDAVVIDDDDDDVESHTDSSPKSAKSTEDRKRSANPEFLNSVYIKDSYLEDFNTSRLLSLEKRKKQREDHEVKAKAYEAKRRAQERALEKQMKYKMRIFDDEPAVTEEIFLSSDEEEEESLPDLTDEMEQMVKNAFRPGNPGEVLSDAFKQQITRRDIATLNGLNWLNDEIINFYMNMLMERGKQDGNAPVWAFNTFFYPKIMSGGHQSVRRWTKQVDIFAMHYVLIPVHLGMHWCLCIADIQNKVIRYFDSMGGRNDKCLEAVRQYINDESVAKKSTPINKSEWSLVTEEDIPQQMNGSDCGMFSCKFAEYVTRGKEITFSQEDMPYFRRRMVYEILAKKLLQ